MNSTLIRITLRPLLESPTLSLPRKHFASGWMQSAPLSGRISCRQTSPFSRRSMDVDRLPSEKFDIYELVLELIILAYNILRIIGQSSSREDVHQKTKRPAKRRRIRTVISNRIQIAGHVTEHARQVVLVLGFSNVWCHTFMDLYRQQVLA